jgi:hypothetical protein
MTRDSANEVAFKQLVAAWIEAMELDAVDYMAAIIRRVRAEAGGGLITRVRWVDDDARPP